MGNEIYAIMDLCNTIGSSTGSSTINSGGSSRFLNSAYNSKLLVVVPRSRSRRSRNSCTIINA